MSAPGPVLVPTRLQTELVLRCHQETDCDLCVRVAIHLAVHGEHVIPCVCTRQHVWDGHKDRGVCRAVLCILSVLLGNTGQRTPRSAWSPCLPPPRPLAWPLLLRNLLPFRKEAKRKASAELRPDLGLILGSF